MSAAIMAGMPVFCASGAVARIRLSRPAQRNALRPADLHWLLDRFAAIEAEPSIRVLVLEAETAGTDRPVFCAGFDLEGFDDPGHDPRLFERVVDALEGLRPITVCSLSGSVYGGATDLLLACDLRVAVRGAEFRMPAVRLGLHYYPSGLARFVSRLGLDLAKRAFLSGRALAVEELAAAGLFDAVVDPAEFESAATTLVERVAGLAPIAAQDTKRSLHEFAAGTADPARLRSREAHSLASHDFSEGRRALSQGRKPVFLGK